MISSAFLLKGAIVYINSISTRFLSLPSSYSHIPVLENYVTEKKT